MPEQEDLKTLAEKVPVAYKDRLAEYLALSAHHKAWLQKLPQEQEWILAYSEADAFRALAAAKGHEYKGNRKAPEPPTKGKELLELAQRRHTAVDAIETGEIKWGSGGGRIADVDPTSMTAIINALDTADRRLLEALITTPADKPIVQKDKDGNVTRTFTALDAVGDLSAHERDHYDLGRTLLDGANSVFPPYPVSKTMPQTPVETQAQ